MSLLLPFVPVTLLAETVYIKDSLLVGLHEEKSIDSAILKVLPTGTALEVLKRENDFVNVRSPNGVVGWISKSYLMDNDPNQNLGTDTAARAAQTRIRELEAEVQNIKMLQSRTEQQHEQTINSDEIAKLTIENNNLKQQIISDKLKSGELQAQLGELKKQLSQSESNKELATKMQLLTETNTQLEDKIKQLQQGRNISEPLADIFNIHNPVILAGIALLLGMLIGIFLMDWRARRRHGGLRF